MNKNLKKIFLVVILYAFSIGFFYNFLELWLTSNQLTTSTVSTVLSICSFLCISVIFLCSNLVTEDKLKKFFTFLLLFRTILTIILYIIDSMGFNFLIKFLTMINYVVDNEALICIYPLICTIKKDDKIFAWKDLLYSAFYNLAVLLTIIFVNKKILNLNITYNSFLICSAIFSLIAFLIIRKVENKVEEKSKNENILKEVFLIVKKDRIASIYFLYIIVGQISYKAIFGLSISFVTKTLNYTPIGASNMFLITGLISTGLGMIAISKLTFKNDYINLSIKFAVRVVFYILASFISNSLIRSLAIMYPLIISACYSHVTDAPYINRYDDKYQLSYSNLKEMVRFFGDTIGTFLCGIALNVSVKLNFFLAAIFGLMQCIFSYYALYLRKKEKK